MAKLSSIPVAVVALVVSAFVRPQNAIAQGSASGGCKALDAETRTRIVHVVARSAHTEPLLPAIEEEKLVPGTCYWQISLSVASSNRRLTLFLAPDRRFVLSNLTDVSVDPWVEEGKRAEQLAQHAEHDHAPTRGPGAAPVTVVVFSDLQCPYCRGFSDMVERYRKENPNRVRLVFRNLPLSTHDWGTPAARAGVCISQQSSSAFWKFHDLMLNKQTSITRENLPGNISEFLKDTPEIRGDEYLKCMNSTVPESRLGQDLSEAVSLRLDATPTIFINGRKYTGFRDDAAFALAVNLANPAEFHGTQNSAVQPAK